MAIIPGVVFSTPQITPFVEHFPVRSPLSDEGPYKRILRN